MKDLTMTTGGPVRKFLLINPFGIGDVLFTTPVVKAIKENYPESFLGYWCNVRVAEILKNNPRIDKIFPLSRGDIKKISDESFFRGFVSGFKLYLGLRREKFDIALDYSLDQRYGLVSKIAGINKRIGYNYKNRGRFLTDRLELSGYTQKHVVDYYLDLLKIFQIKPVHPALELFVSDNNKRQARHLLKSEGIEDSDLLVGICSGGGASWGKDSQRKHWPAVNFAQLADKLISAYGAKVILLGDESERPVALAIKGYMNHPVIDLTGRTSLENLAALISQLHLLLTNDAGPLHMAVALDRKTVSFFGPVDARVYGPYAQDKTRHIVLQSHDLDCRPCYQNFRLAECSHNRECLEKITIQEAFRAASNLLSDKHII